MEAGHGLAKWEARGTPALQQVLLVEQKNINLLLLSGFITMI